jgi:two-component system, OmpR family, heavy metal sensor histidine kinase CusS
MTRNPLSFQGRIPWLHSFRLRIALLSALLAGAALVGFSVMAWVLIRETTLRQLDDAISMQLYKAAAVPYPESYWSTYDDTLLEIFDASHSSQVALRVINPDSMLVYQSQSWPSGLVPSVPEVFPSGPPKDRSVMNGPLRDGPPRNGPPRNGPPRNGPPRNGPPRNGPPRNGPPIDGLPSLKVENQAYQAVNVPEFLSHWRVGVFHTEHRQVAIAINLKTLDRTLGPIRTIALITVPLTFLLVALAAWLLAGIALRSLDRVNASISRVTAQGLDQRIAEEEADQEFVVLIQAFNQMLGRLERSFQQASRFSGDAAHELKTPLAVLQGKLEQSIQQAELGSLLQEHLGEMLEEVSRLSSILRKLLLLSLADAGRMQLMFSEVNLSQLFDEMMEDMGLLSSELTLHVEVEANLIIEADLDLLRQVFQNLATNAVKYNLPGGWIRLTAKGDPNQVFVTLTNQAEDLEEEVRDRLFERFYRADLAHGRQKEGVGLGLSLAREIVRSHQGELRLAAAQPGEVGIILILPKKRRC